MTVSITIHITACGSFALDVPNLNFLNFDFVSGEKVYNRDSDAYDHSDASITNELFFSLTMLDMSFTVLN